MLTLPDTAEIKVDQAGYLPEAKKIAFCTKPAGSFAIRRAKDDKVVYHGKWSAPSAVDADSGDRVESADFSELREPGEYYIQADGKGRSWPFFIADGLLKRAYILTSRSFYGQRCGTAVDLGSEFPGFRHGECHRDGAFDASSGKSAQAAGRGTRQERNTADLAAAGESVVREFLRNGKRASEKGWHDAGDYGRYVVNSGISTATLLWAAELYGSKINQIALTLPESGNGTPDLLNEARWNIDWMLSMQDSDGGVWHKQTSSHFCPFIAPEADTLPSLVIGSGQEPFKTSCATADFAAVTAIAGRLYARYDKAYAERCLLAARKAWAWVMAHPAVPFSNPSGITTGEYGDKDCRDELLWAAAELAQTTGEAEFNSYFDAHYAQFLGDIAVDDPPSWSKVSAFALWTYALGKGGNHEAVAAIEAQSTRAADSIVSRAAGSPYRTTLVRKNYVWGSNGVVANYCLQLLIAHQLHPDARYIETANDNIHYLFGRNPLSISYVTHLGANPVKHIHHRPSGDAAHVKNPWPGLLSGGPNAGKQDKEMQSRLPADCPPARAFLDLQGAYAANEVAINWNAPLVFSLAGLL